MLGTAFPAARLLLVEQPFPWGPEGLRTSHFDREVALALEARGRAEGVRVQAIRRTGRTPESGPHRWMAVDTRDASRSLRWGEYVEPQELLDLPLDGSTGAPDPAPLYLVCTHGRHDPCCASRGRPVITELTARRPDHVWQTSHLGGCRFAPTVLVLPSGTMYGRVPPSGAGDLIEAAEAGEVLRDLLRGRIGVPPVAQAALAYAHEQLALPRLEDLAVIATTKVDWGTSVVRIHSRDGRFDVTVRRTRVDASGLTCGSPGPSWFVAHQPVAIEPALPAD